MPPSNVDPRSVFLNVPFDESYEKLFTAILLALVAIGRTPRSVLEIPDTGQGRLQRLKKIISHCRFSIHDLSRVGIPVRFNMPFELGLAHSSKRTNPKHGIIILERVDFRFERGLSDLKGAEVSVHHGSPKQAIDCILNILQKTGQGTSPDDVYDIWRFLYWPWVKVIKSKGGRNTIYRRSAFKELVTIATQVAVESDFIGA